MVGPRPAPSVRLLLAARAVREDVLVLVHGGPVAEPKDAAYVLARAERMRMAAGTEARRSHDTGAGSAFHYASLPSPDAGSKGSSLAPGGGDTDLAVAPVKNSAGYYNVYVASLSLANVDVSTSMNGGKTFALNPIGATISGDDREWIAADGASKVCISYHDAATFNLDVNCSYDAGTTFTQPSDAIDTAHAYNIDNNETGNLEGMVRQALEVLPQFSQRFQLVSVDDGSIDGSFAVLEELAARDPRVKVVRLRRNFGQTAAMQAGIDYAGGDVLVTMDGDLQNDPADIPMLLAKLDEGCAVVYGVPKHRPHAPWRNLTSWMIKRIMRRAIGVKAARRRTMVRPSPPGRGDTA